MDARFQLLAKKKRKKEKGNALKTALILIGPMGIYAFLLSIFFFIAAYIEEFFLLVLLSRVTKNADCRITLPDN